MRVSVIVPLYNKEQSVVRALDSILSQTMQEFEVIVVNDGSTDASADLVSACPDRRIRLVHQHNSGPGAARNRGIAEMTGDFVAFLDADDAWMPDYLETVLQLFQEHDSTLATVTSGWVEYPQGTSRESFWRKRGIDEGLHSVTAATEPLILHYMVSYMWPCSTIARTDIVRKYNGFHDKNLCSYGEDTSLWLKILLNHPVYFLMRPHAYFHRESSQLSANYTQARPIEPFLIDPHEVSSVCPPELQKLLHQFYALRACKTAAMLGYWGDSGLARSLFRRFVTRNDWKLPFFLLGLVGSTPLAGVLGPLLPLRTPTKR